MKLPDPDPDLLAAATRGQPSAVDALLRALQPPVFNLALRLLGHRADAQDATQEILLQVLTHLSSFRGEARFSTWVFAIARHHLLRAKSRAVETESLDDIGDKLDAGLAFGGRVDAHTGAGAEAELAARQLALGCTQGMLMTLARDERLVLLLDLLFDLDSREAAAVCGISPAAYRQRLHRARRRLEGFTTARCGHANPAAACRCEKQLPALATQAGRAPPQVIAITPVEQREAEGLLTRLGEAQDRAQALLRIHPAYAVPPALLADLRGLLDRAMPT